MKIKRLLFAAFAAAALSMLAPAEASAQQVALGTNAIDYAELGTLNLNCNVSVGRRFTLGANVRYNPWVFKPKTEQQFNSKVRGGSIDFRYWPWHVYSGWWIMLKGQVLEYNVGGLFDKPECEQGLAYGAGIGFGYSLMLGKHWNVDFGITGWGGAKKYRLYDCPYCGYPLKDETKGFIAPDNLMVSFYYIF